MSICPFCSTHFDNCLSHASKAHRGQTITLALKPIDTLHSVTMFDSLDRLERMATKHDAMTATLGENLDWAILGALIRALRQGATKNEATA